jgi:hypothetical protein
VDFFTTVAYPQSNQCKIFYIDAPLLAQPNSPSAWDITDDYPSMAMETIAHEFQHMIHFWQKITRGVQGDDTWVNEMCSMQAEDFASSPDKLNVKGPRGIIGTGSGSCVTDGRFPTYIENTDLSLDRWYTGNNVYASYAIAYAFGSYLARNFGGVNLFHDIVNNTDSAGTDCVTYALSINAPGETFQTAMRKWGIANMISQVTNLPGTGYRYNNGINSQDGTIGSINYSLNSINVFNYVSYCQMGPTVRNYLPRGGIAQTSNFYYQAATALPAGPYSWTIDLPAGVMMSVVMLYQ